VFVEIEADCPDIAQLQGALLPHVLAGIPRTPTEHAVAFADECRVPKCCWHVPNSLTYPDDQERLKSGRLIAQIALAKPAVRSGDCRDANDEYQAVPAAPSAAKLGWEADLMPAGATRSKLLYPPTMYETALAELRLLWRDGNHYVGRDDISRWSEDSGLSPSSIFDRFAVELASDFWVGFLGWEFADGAANALHGALLKFATSTEDFRWPESFEEFYLLFDHSEMNGPRDRQLIREFLQKHKALLG